MTIHGVEEMEADRLTIFDVEHCILTGQIIERQREQARGEWKYLVEGETLHGDGIVTVGKISASGKLVIITTYQIAGGGP